jgi:hypothetical protein
MPQRAWFQVRALKSYDITRAVAGKSFNLPSSTDNKADYAEVLISTSFLADSGALKRCVYSRVSPARGAYIRSARGKLVLQVNDLALGLMLKYCCRSFTMPLEPSEAFQIKKSEYCRMRWSQALEAARFYTGPQPMVPYTIVEK